jgi:protein YibB
MNIAVMASVYGYKPDQIKPWMNSLKSSGFKGKVFVIVYNPDGDELLQYLKDNGVFTFVSQLNGETNMATQRFLEYKEILSSEYAKDVEAVITTDIRDVIFQSDPGVWLKNNIQDYHLIATSEGVTFRHEDWGGEALETHFGKEMFLKFADRETICSGIIAGKKEAMIKLCETVYELAFFSQDPGAFVDQIFYAIAIYEIYDDITKIVPATENWCANLGTLKAIPENMPLWSTGARTGTASYERFRKNKTFVETMKCKVPEMREDGLIYADNGLPFSIVHQYDRYQPWKEHFMGTDKPVTLVTALYDIKRENWDGFSRNLDQYKEWMKGMLSFDSPMIIYVEEKDVEFVTEQRASKLDKTQIIALPFDELYTNKLWGDSIRKVMASEEFLKDQTVPTHPQIAQPNYNILMHEKMQFVKRAVEENRFNTEHFMWVDAGIFHMSNRKDVLGQTFPRNQKYLDDKLHFIAVEQPTEADLELEKFFKGHNVRIIGTSWIGHKDAILEFERGYSELMAITLANGLMDQDQSYLTVTALKYPKICEIHKGSWPDAINLWV